MSRRNATPIYSGRQGERPVSDTALALWMKAHHVTAYSLSRELSIDPKCVTQWAENRTLPGLLDAFLIEKATGGGVPVSSWLGTDLAAARLRNRGMDWENWQEKVREATARYRQKLNTKVIDG